MQKRHTESLLESVSQRELYQLWCHYIGEDEELLSAEPTMDVEGVFNTNSIRTRKKEIKELKNRAMQKQGRGDVNYQNKLDSTTSFLFSSPLLSGRRPVIHFSI
jgi:hypothetical protein